MMMLIENYRSHPDLIKIPSDLFYESKLIVSPNAEPKDLLADWDRLPKKGVPLIWHHIADAEKKWSMIDKDVQGGYSYCNYGEIQQVIKYVEQLTSDLHITPQDIGIISPYKLQVIELSRELRGTFPDITIDTVERFQGSERRVIIISPVRSTDKMGFVKCPKRFNTTVTRAKELLIIVGNHQVMGKSPEWKSLIDYCLSKGAVIDVKPDASTDGVESDEPQPQNVAVWPDDPPLGVESDGPESQNVPERVAVIDAEPQDVAVEPQDAAVEPQNVAVEPEI